VHGVKTQNFFPTVGANGPCQVHVNFGQLGFVFIEANVKKWGLAPMTGSLAPPPPYGSEQGSILLEGGREGVREGMGASYFGHNRGSSQQYRMGRTQPTSPGPQRSPTDISLAALSLVDSQDENDVGEGASGSVATLPGAALAVAQSHENAVGLGFEAPPDYESPKHSPDPEASSRGEEDDREPLLQESRQHTPGPGEPPIPSYSDAVAETRRGRSDTRESRS